MTPILTVGNEYVVMNMSAVHNHDSNFNIAAPYDARPVVFDARQFEFVDPEIPDHWVMDLVTDSNWLEIGPPEFMNQKFWEDLHEFEPYAELIYARELVRRGIDLAGTWYEKYADQV